MCGEARWYTVVYDGFDVAWIDVRCPQSFEFLRWKNEDILKDAN